MSTFTELKEELITTNLYFIDNELKQSIGQKEVAKKQSQLWFNLYKKLYFEDPVGFSTDTAMVYCYYNFNLITNYLAGLSNHKIYTSLPSNVSLKGYSILGGKQMFLLLIDIHKMCKFKFEGDTVKLFNNETQIASCDIPRTDAEFAVHEQWLKSWGNLPLKPYVKNLNRYFYSREFSYWVLNKS